MSNICKNLPKTSHILAIDFGKFKVGLAMADMETKIAFAYDTIANDKNLPEKIAEIAKKEKVKKIIIGKPFHKNSQNQEAYEKFGQELNKIVPQAEIIFFNEMFTTKMAQENLKEKGLKNIQKLDDAEAARVLLEEWISCYN